MNSTGRVLRLTLFAACWTVSASGARATGRAECLTTSSRILAHPVPFCALLPPSYDGDPARRYPVLYFLHGLGDDEQSLVRFGGFNLVEDLWEKGKLGEFVIVTPDADASFYVNSRDGRVRYEDFFLQEFLPFIEHRYRLRPGRRYRGIGGISMGGYGALRIAFKYPERFGAVSAHSAALIERLPVAVANAPVPPRLRILGGVFGAPPDPVFWERNNPFTLARTSAALPSLIIYFDCGSEDDYGFAAGAQALHRLLETRRIRHEFHLYPGGHNWSYFAMHLSNSLQFHSLVFGLATR